MRIGEDALGVQGPAAALRGAGAPARETGAAGEGGFAAGVTAALQDTNQALTEAEHAARELARGKGDIVDTMLALGKADVSLRTVVSLRNRMLESYQQVMRMQV